MALKSRPIQEEGVVLSKEFKKASEGFTASDGHVVPAQPDRYIVTVASSYQFTADMGFVNPAVLEYKVEKELFDKLKYGTKVLVLYEMSNGNTPKPLSLQLKA